jgi:hypothetical protein
MAERGANQAQRSCARVIRLAGVAPERELALVASLARRPGTSALVISQLEGDAAALGSRQRAGRSLAAREVRRLGGGRSTQYGDGVVSLCALAPAPQAWLSESGTLAGPRLLNRLVRGLLAGLSRLGVVATYPGRDFALANGRRIAYVSLAQETSGVLLFHALIGVGAPYTTAEREPSWPGLPAAPAATSLARERVPAPDFAAIASAIAAGFADRFSLTLDESALTADEERACASPSALPLVDAALAGLYTAGPIATPIGELEAHVALDADARLARVRLCGDFMAGEAGLEALERDLVGALPGSARVRELCAAWLANPASLVIGLSGASALADAIARSARAYSTPGARPPSE